MNFINLFESFTSSTSEENLSAVPIKGTNHLLAKDFNQNPYFLFKVIENNSSPIAINLYNLSTLPNEKLRVVVNGQIHENKYYLIKYEAKDGDLQDIFLKIIGSLVEYIGEEFSSRDFDNLVTKLVELFRTISESKPTISIQGLWAELFCISLTNEPEKFITGWHRNPKEKFDFSFDGLAIEVKSTSKRNPRSHIFKQEQLESISNQKIIIASVITEEMDGGGLSISDLIEKIEGSIDNSDCLIKLNQVVCESLGSDISKINDYSYNFNLAKDLFSIYDSQNIPQILDSHRNISNITFRANIDDIEMLNKSLDDILISATLEV